MKVVTCDKCNNACHREWKLIFSNTKRKFYYHQAVTESSVWLTHNNNRCKILCEGCVVEVISLSWSRCTSKTTGMAYFYNFATGQSSLDAPPAAVIPSPHDQAMGPAVTPQHLEYKRNYFYQGLQISQSVLQSIQIDQVASFSVTESKSADVMSKLICKHCRANPKTLTIFDGMSCVGGNTLSFAKYFGKVIANELDFSRYHMLMHNVTTLMREQQPNNPCNHIDYYNTSVLSLMHMPTSATFGYHIIFFDPEWGGPGYKEHGTDITLVVGDVPVEEVIVSLGAVRTLQMIALKLPTTYNNALLAEVARKTGFSYTLYTEEFKKMTLTILSR